MSVLGQAWSALRKRGVGYVLREAVPHLHRHYVRDHLPRRVRELNGVTVRSTRLFDDAVPWSVGHRNPSEYETGIVDGLRRTVDHGDKVVIVGGGWGVSTVVAASETGQDGSVVTYEASPSYAEYVRETVDLNGVTDLVTVENTVVGESLSVRGGEVADRLIAPADLPECDVLELDCEGAELAILDGIEHRPPFVIVETHGYLGAPTETVTERLREMNYAVLSDVLAESGDLAADCRENDVHVLTAEYRP